MVGVGISLSPSPSISYNFEINFSIVSEFIGLFLVAILIDFEIYPIKRPFSVTFNDVSSGTELVRK